MYIVYLVTHVIMVICFFGIICSSFDLSSRLVKREKDRAIIPVLKEDSAPKEPNFKKKASNDIPAGLKAKHQSKNIFKITRIQVRYGKV
ncbi:hypothetical protein [Mucilaginibacter sp.]|uniref:hypothetical protein n=1 Tax=Mucilaginibacter sp. TaxID=1882438 RepID=UPI0026285FB9|nr:hypothetical protein [Mucilaginibacter sp.]MDB4923243.1 hypothetical protein [Mucilaginibacter sp.]